MTEVLDTLAWSAQYQVAPRSSASRLQGDKITLPPSALEALLAAAPVVNVNSTSGPAFTSTFDPFNPYTFAAEQHARQQFGDRQQQLPHPLTFRLVNPRNGRVVFAGIREFSANADEIGLSDVLSEALGLSSTPASITREHTPNGDVQMSDGETLQTASITVHAKQLPKGTYVRLRPLEAGYDPDDWKSLLERYLRDNFTTLTKGEVLTVGAGRHEKFQFLVDKLEPEGEGICIVDTDLEVDIEALNEEQARETLSKRLAKKKRGPGTSDGSSAGGVILLGEEHAGQVLAGEYVDYELRGWDKGRQGVEVELEIGLEDAEIDLFTSPFSSKQRSKPRSDEHVLGDFSSRPSKRIKLSPTNIELEDAESLLISVHGFLTPGDQRKLSRPVPFSLRTTGYSGSPPHPSTNTANGLNPGDITCKNCHQNIPKATLPLHEAFCYRNNVSCPQCDQVFLKNSATWKSHWHCPHDSFFGNTSDSKQKHDSIFHPEHVYDCPNCDFQASDLPSLANHRTSVCPSKEIVCQFCHLTVAQQGPEDPSFTDPEVLLSGLTPHELTDGGRTTECHLCNKIVRLRDMKTHLRLHDRDRITRAKPRLCSNVNCGRTIPATSSQLDPKSTSLQLGLCNDCFGPLYVTSYDPDGKALRRRVERRILQQLMAGCGKSWCANTEFCRTARKSSSTSGEDRILSAKDALPLVRPVMDNLNAASSSGSGPGGFAPLYFCVDETSQKRRHLAALLAADQRGEYEIEWCVKALEETAAGGSSSSSGDLRAARDWLVDRAPRIGEVIR